MTSTPPSIPSGGASSSTDITAITFHGFPKLPPELRVKIWKAACLPRTDNDHGLQYITVDVVSEYWEDHDIVVFDEDLDGYYDEFDMGSRETGYITLRAMKRIKKQPSNTHTPSNQFNKKSAYLWDAGLWLACKESRDVITEYLAIDKWIQVAEQQHPPDLLFPPVWYNKKFPSTLVPHRKDKLWRPMVVPRSDIFCIAAGPLRALPISLYGMKMLAPFLGQRKFTITEDWNIAFKFDSSWNEDFPEHIGHLLVENSRRSLLALWVQRFADEVYPEPTLWIIDDTASWVTLPGLECKTMYRDCDAEYIQAHWCALHQNRGTRGRCDVEIFMSSLAELVDEGAEEWFGSAKDHIRLLVRKENEIPTHFVAGPEDEA